MLFWIALDLIMMLIWASKAHALSYPPLICPVLDICSNSCRILWLFVDGQRINLIFFSLSLQIQIGQRFRRLYWNSKETMMILISLLYTRLLLIILILWQGSLTKS